MKTIQIEIEETSPLLRQEGITIYSHKYLLTK